MQLKEILLNDMKQSLKEKDTIKKDVVQIIRAGVLQIEKDNKTELGDDGIIDVISKEIKKRIDILPDYEKSGRTDSIEAINRQLEILKSYLPEQLNEDEISRTIDETMLEISASTMKDMGKLMQTLSIKFGSRADNKIVSQLVKSKLQ